MANAKTTSKRMLEIMEMLKDQGPGQDRAPKPEAAPVSDVVPPTPPPAPPTDDPAVPPAAPEAAAGEPPGAALFGLFAPEADLDTGPSETLKASRSRAQNPGKSGPPKTKVAVKRKRRGDAPDLSDDDSFVRATESTPVTAVN